MSLAVTIALFLFILAIVGTIEFVSYALVVVRTATPENIVEFPEIFTSWLNNVVIHLVIDSISSAFITMILSFLLERR